jgi:hypothetical protein
VVCVVWDTLKLTSNQMPPKKAKKAKAAAESEIDGAELALAEKLIKASLELAALQRELEMKNEIIIRQTHTIERQKSKIDLLETTLDAKTKDRMELTSGTCI